MGEFTRITDVRIRELEMEEFFLDMGEFTRITDVRTRELEM